MPRIDVLRLVFAIALLAGVGFVRPLAAEPSADDPGGTGVVIEGPLVGLQITVDGDPAWPDATGFIALAPAVDHRLVVRVPLYVPFVLRLAVAPGEVRAVRPRLYRETSLAPRPGAAPTPEAVRRSRSFGLRHWPSLTALGLGVAGLATGAVLHVLASQDWAAIDDAPRDDDGAVIGLTEREAGALADRARERELGGWIGFALGGGFLAASTVLLVLEPFGEDAGLALTPAPGGVVLTGAW